MTVYSHHVVGFGAGRREAVLDQIKTVGAAAVAAGQGRLIGLFKPLIGLSLNHAIIIAVWADDACV